MQNIGRGMKISSCSSFKQHEILSIGLAQTFFWVYYLKLEGFAMCNKVTHNTKHYFQVTIKLIRPQSMTLRLFSLFLEGIHVLFVLEFFKV